jgi:hypothetical protein
MPPETLNVNVLVAAKEEYTKQMITCLTPIIYAGLNNIYKDSQKMNIRRPVSYSNFQKSLQKVPGWTSFRLSDEVERTKKSCPYLMDLVTAIFVSHVKILACVRLKGDHKSIKIKIPSIESFLHKLYINISEKVYYAPTVIHDKKEDLYSLISETVDETIRNQIPIESILTEYLSGVWDDNNDDEEKDMTGADIISEAGSDISDISDISEEYNDTQKTVPTIPIERPLDTRPDLQNIKEDDICSVISSVKEEDENEEDEDEDEDEDDEEKPVQQLITPPAKIVHDDKKPDVTLFNDI